MMNRLRLGMLAAGAFACVASALGAQPGGAERDIRYVALGCRLDNEVDSATAHPRVVSFFSELFGSVAATNDAAPIVHVHAAMAPILVMMGDAEQVDPPILADAQRFAERAKAVGVEVGIEVLPDRKHMTAMQGLARADDIAFVRVMRFIQTGKQPAIR